MSEIYTFGEFRLDVDARVLTYRETPVKLTAKCIAVLVELARLAPDVVSRAQFEAAVWPDGFVEASNLTQTMYVIRSTLARYDSTPLIDTYDRRGYRLVAESARLP